MAIRYFGFYCIGWYFIRRERMIFLQWYCLQLYNFLKYSMKENKTIRVLVTEKEEFRFKVLAKMLQPYPDISLVGYASEREEMFRLLQNAPVDVLLFDITLFRNESSNLISLLNSGFPRLKVIVCTDNHLGYYFRETMSNCLVSAHAPKAIDAPDLVGLVSEVFHTPDEQQADTA